MRLALADLLPATNYAVQVRITDGGEYSEWSPIFSVLTEEDRTLPAKPTNPTIVVNGSNFTAEWDSVTTNVAGAKTMVVRYEVEFSNGAVAKLFPANQMTGTRNSYEFSFEENRKSFGTPKPVIGFRVRAVDNRDLKSDWTTKITATNPPPGPPTNVVATAGLNSISVIWDAPADIDIIGYSIYQGGVKQAFVAGTSYIRTTTTYVPTVISVRSVDRFNQESTAVDSNAVTPESPLILDTSPPPQPTNIAATITNNTNGIGARAAVSWALASPPSDLAGFYLRYRKVGATFYSNVTFQRDERNGVIELQESFTNYEFQMKAFDWSNNESAWTATLTSNSPVNTAPPVVTGLVAAAGSDSIRYSWSTSTATDLKEYEFTFSTSPTFASGNITFKTGTANTLTVSGLSSSTTYYGRVRAIDVGGLISPSWSSTVTTQTTTGPTFDITDGVAPSYSPTPSVSSGIGYLFVTWSAVANADPVTYDVYLSTNPAFVPSESNRCFEVSGTMCTIRNEPGTTTPLSYGVTYYVKLIARDRDGSAAVGDAGSGSITKAIASDIVLTPSDIGAATPSDVNQAKDDAVAEAGSNTDSKITDFNTNMVMPALNGKNKTTYSSNPPGTASNIVGDVWRQYVGTEIVGEWKGDGGTSWTAMTLTDSVITNLNAGTITAGELDADRIGARSIVALKIAVGTITAESGVLANASILNANIADAAITTAKIDDAQVTNAKIADLAVTNAKIDDATIESAKIKELSATKLIAGTLGNGVGIIMAPGSSILLQGGSILSNTYQSSGGSTGFSLSDSGLVVKTGSVSAAALDAGTITGVKTIELGTGAKIKGGSWELSSTGLLIPDGGVLASKVNVQVGQNILPYSIATMSLPMGVTPVILSTATNGTIVMDKASYYYSGQSLKVANTAATGRDVIFAGTTTENNIVIPESGAKYIISMWIRPTVTNALTLKLHNGSSLHTSATAKRVTDDATTLVANTWQRIYMVSSAVNVVGANVRLTLPAITGTWNIDGLQVEVKLDGNIDGSPSPWSPPSTTTIDGSMVKTGSITSNQLATIIEARPVYDADGNLTGYNDSYTITDPSNRPAWFVDMGGSAEFSNLFVRGNAVVGAPPGATDIADVVAISSNITSGSPTVTSADGAFSIDDVGRSVSGTGIPAGTKVKTFVNVSTITLTANATTTATINLSITRKKIRVSAISSADYVPNSTGWTIRSDGFAEFRNLAVDSVGTAQLKSNAVGADQLESYIDVQSTLQWGDTVKLSSNGLYITGAQGDTEFPASGDAIIRAALVTNSLSVNGGLSIQATNNELGKNAVLTVQSGTTPPTAGPQVSEFYPTGSVHEGFNSRGLMYFPEWSSNTWLSTESLYAGIITGLYRDGNNLLFNWASWSTGDTRPEILSAMGGIAKSTQSGITYVYLLCEVNEPQPGTYRNKWYLYKFKFNGAGAPAETKYSYVARWLYQPNGSTGAISPYRPFMGNDGNNIVVIQCNSNGEWLAWVFDTTNSTSYLKALRETNGAIVNAPGNITGFASYGGRWYISLEGRRTLYAHNPSVTNGRSSGDDFLSPATGASLCGVTHDGTRFFTRSNNQVFSHSNISVPDIKTNAINVVQTWRLYNSSPTAGKGYASAETSPSPRTSTISFSNRAWMRISSKSPIINTPSDPTDPDAVSFYMARGAAPSDASYVRVPLNSAGVTSIELDTLPTSGNSYPTATNFGVASPGSIRSNAMSGGEYLWKLNGDGSGKVGPMQWDTAGNYTMPGDTVGWVYPAQSAGWSNTGGTDITLRYAKRTGIVYIHGTVSGGTLGATIFVLPVGCRPVGKINLPVACSGGYGRLVIQPTGEVMPISGGNGWFAIDAQFPTA